MGRNRRWTTLVLAVMASLLLVSVATLDATASTKPKKVSIVESSLTYTFSFSPKAVSIHKGRRVKWTNNTTSFHHILFTNGVTFSKDVTVGDSVSKVFRKRGTFHYHCTIHPKTMKGTVTVT